MWQDIKTRMYPTIDFAIKNGRWVSFTGLPECMLLGFRGLVVDSWHPFDEEMRPNGTVVNISRRRAQYKKVKSPKCRNCFWNASCEGLWKSYAVDYGKDELIPQQE